MKSRENVIKSHRNCHAETSVSIDTLVARVEKLEVSRHYSSLRKKKSNDDDSDAQILVVDESMRRARLAVESSNIYSAQWAMVPQPDYYTWTLEERAKCLKAPSIHYLCKSLLMENKKHSSMNNDKESVSDVTNPKFFLVVIQYAATLDVSKTINVLRSLRPVGSRLDAGQFDLRIASSEDNDAVTGYSHNSVTPFGLLQQDVPILLTDAVVPLKYFWMGGGAVHVKLRVTVADFCRSLPHVIVGDISRPRTGVMSANDLED
ncbi:hypothetical protein MPSEU_000833800 [Mayamaea pseudoterrestris]|nr:hypothetical protein MPSEU_000833800 [Mayamaea pseudoterrestris]